MLPCQLRWSLPEQVAQRVISRRKPISIWTLQHADYIYYALLASVEGSVASSRFHLGVDRNEDTKSHRVQKSIDLDKEVRDSFAVELHYQVLECIRELLQRGLIDIPRDSDLDQSRELT